MYLGQQLTDLSERRLALEAQLGVEYVALQKLVSGNQHWTLLDIQRTQDWCNEFGLRIGALALDTDSLFRSMARSAAEAEGRLQVVLENIATAGEAGIDCLKYRFQPIGVLRTQSQRGRGGAQYSSFDFEQYDGTETHSSAYFSEDELKAISEEIVISESIAWEVLHQFLEAALPVAEEAGVRLAIHPQDAPLPLGRDDLRVQHVLSSIDSLQRLIDLYPSPSNGLNFCQGTVAEMCIDPAVEVLDAIRKFGTQGKIFMVHFRNIQGGFLNFREVYPDNGDVNMLQAMRVYKEVGYQGMFCPDHVPMSESDADKERQFSFCLGYIRGLLQSVNADAEVASQAPA
jgi:mannonate dehydratase